MSDERRPNEGRTGTVVGSRVAPATETMMTAALDRIFEDYHSGYSLPAELYHSHDAFERDLEVIFRNEWLFACNVAEIPCAGDHIKVDVGPDSIVVVKGEDGEVRAFHNVCRHRGSRICLAERGSGTRLTCPYHQWTYDLSGRLIHASHMGEGFDARAFGLTPVHIETVCGMVFVCLAAAPPDFSHFRASIAPYLAPHAPERTKLAYRSRIVEKANWKLVIENNRECYHCAGSHPELLASLVEVMFPEDEALDPRLHRLLAEKAALWDDLGLPHLEASSADFRCIRLPFDNDALSMTMDGKAASKVLLGDLEEPDLGSVRLFRPPSTWNHIMADHIVHFRCLPISPEETEVVTTWLVHEDAVEGLDYDVKRLTEVWLATNEQDKRLAENNHLGTRSSAYRPGPYAQTEAMVANFVDWYVYKMRGRSAAFLAAAE